MVWRSKNLYEACLPFNTLYALIGHGVFQYPIGRPRLIFSFIYSIILTTLLYSWVLAYAYTHTFKLSWKKSEERLFLCINVIQLVILGSAQFLNWYHAKASICMMKRITCVDETLQQLGANLHYDKSKNMAIFMMTYWLVMVVALNFVDTFWVWNGPVSYGEAYRMIMTANYSFHDNTIVALNFSVAVRILESRYHVLNEIIASSSESHFEQQPEDDRAAREFSRYEDSKMNSTPWVSSQQILRTGEKFKIFIQTIKHVHLELVTVSRSLEKIYGIQMGLEMACFFFSITGLLWDIFNLATEPFVERRNLRITIASTWLVVMFFNLMIINQSCESTSREAARTGELTSCIGVSRKDPELRDEISQFSLQLMKNPLHFSPVGCFTLGHSFVRTFIVSVITHVVILIDLGVAK